MTVSPENGHCVYLNCTSAKHVTSMWPKVYYIYNVLISFAVFLGKRSTPFALITSSHEFCLFQFCYICCCFIDVFCPSNLKRLRLYFISLHSGQVAHQAGAYPGFYSMKRLGVFLLPPGWDASPSQGYLQH